MHDRHPCIIAKRKLDEFESTPSYSETVSVSDIDDLCDFLGENNVISPGVPLSGRHVVEVNILEKDVLSICAEVLNSWHHVLERADMA